MTLTCKNDPVDTKSTPPGSPLARRKPQAIQHKLIDALCSLFLEGKAVLRLRKLVIDAVLLLSCAYTARLEHCSWTLFSRSKALGIRLISRSWKAPSQFTLIPEDPRTGY